MNRKITLCFAIALSLFLLLPFFTPAAQPQTPTYVAQGRGGAVASVDRLATRIGIETLQAGGNAIDAAVATAAVLGVTEPFSAGVGGGDFMMIYLKAEDRVITLDGREEAPASAHPQMFQNPDSPTGEPLPFSPNRISSGVAVGVPGTVATWVEALRRYGTLGLGDVILPAIYYAENGFEVDQTFANQVQQNQERFSAFPATAALYLPQGKPPAIGSVIKNPDLAKTYQIISSQGINGFYRGEIGRAIAQTVQNPPTVETPPFPVIPGGMTLDDLDRYETRVRSPLVTEYRGYKLYGMGLPTSGGITSSEVLNILNGFDLPNLDRVKAWHSVIEAQRLAFADRNAFLGDPEYVDVPLAGLLNPDYAQTRRGLIGDRAPANEKEFRATAGDPLPFQSDPSPSLTAVPKTATIGDHEGLSTTHLSVADRFGNLVSYTLTIESTGGSGMVVPGYGFLLNNELTDFDATVPHPNTPEPSKRPRSSMAPTIAFAPDGRAIAFGSPGGSTIITTVLGIGCNLMDFGMSLSDAIAAPRISQRNGGGTQVDSGFEKTELGKELMAIGHLLEPMPEIGAATGVLVNPDGSMVAAAEPSRRGGGSAMTVSR
ncbi:MAG: gamma-glutamyltransferase [Oculatellaceae cyanobacterium Prado106]|jgi:gamma-glutamyltranspeptidase/glutathione hydrolase|nr:gamma-glutamyltransferase [Oculatellaceae cyanobacterium Prado106]